MKIQASLLAALTAQNQVEATFWNPFSLFKPSKPTQSQFAPMPAQTASVSPVDVLCQDDFLRCSQWKHACDVKSIQKICAKTCGSCSGSVPAPVAAEPAPVEPKQSYPAPAKAPVQTPVQAPVQDPVYNPFVDPVAQVLGNRPSYQATQSGFSSNFYPRPVQQVQPVYQPIYQVPIYQAPVQQTSCGDQFSGCSAWKSVCGNGSIQKLCPGTCGLCGNQAFNIAPVAQPVAQPVYWSAQRPVVQQPIYQAPVEQVVQEPVYQAPVEPVVPVTESCTDKYTNCEAYRDQCSNRIIINVCQKSCGACVEAVTMPTMAPTTPPTMAPTYASTTTASTTTTSTTTTSTTTTSTTTTTTTTTEAATTTEEPESSGDNQLPWASAQAEAEQAGAAQMEAAAR